MTFDEWNENYVRLMKAMPPECRVPVYEQRGDAWSAGFDAGRASASSPEVRHAPSSEITNGGWIEIPNDETDLGECLVGRWYRGKKPQFLAFQRHSPCLGWVERQDFFTHYKPVDAPKPPQFPEPRNEEGR